MENDMLPITVQAKYDGTSFFPQAPVAIPAGATVTLSIDSVPQTDSKIISAMPPPPVTEEHKQLWEELQREWDANPPEEATVDEYMRKIRGPSWS